MFLKILQKFTGKHLYQSLFYNKVKPWDKFCENFRSTSFTPPDGVLWKNYEQTCLLYLTLSQHNIEKWPDNFDNIIYETDKPFLLKKKNYPVILVISISFQYLILTLFCLYFLHFSVEYSFSSLSIIILDCQYWYL